MPLHSAIASARMRSSLSVEAKCWGMIPQGLHLFIGFLYYRLITLVIGLNISMGIKEHDLISSAVSVMLGSGKIS